MNFKFISGRCSQSGDKNDNDRSRVRAWQSNGGNLVTSQIFLADDYTGLFTIITACRHLASQLRCDPQRMSQSLYDCSRWDGPDRNHRRRPSSQNYVKNLFLSLSRLICTDYPQITIFPHVYIDFWSHCENHSFQDCSVLI